MRTSAIEEIPSGQRLNESDEFILRKNGEEHEVNDESPIDAAESL